MDVVLQLFVLVPETESILDFFYLANGALGLEVFVSTFPVLGVEALEVLLLAAVFLAEDTLQLSDRAVSLPEMLSVGIHLLGVLISELTDQTLPDSAFQETPLLLLSLHLLRLPFYPFIQPL